MVALFYALNLPMPERCWPELGCYPVTCYSRSVRPCREIWGLSREEGNPVVNWGGRLDTLWVRDSLGGENSSRSGLAMALGHHPILQVARQAEVHGALGVAYRLQIPSKWMDHRTYSNGNEIPYGQLTKKGAEQARELGQTLRRHYGELLDLPVEPLDPPGWLHLRSTDFRRTHMTGFYVLSGLLESESRAGKLKFNIRGTTEETLCVHTDACPRLSALWKRVWKEVCKQSKMDGEVHEGGWRAEHQREKRIMADFLGISSSGSFPWMMAIDFLDCRRAHGDRLPQGLNESDLVRLRELILEDHAKCIQHEGLMPFFGGRMITELYRDMKKAVEHREKADPLKPRLALYSAHDITLLPLSVSIGVPMKKWPPYASVMCFELWSTMDGQSHFVRVLFNWEELALQGRLSDKILTRCEEKDGHASRTTPANKLAPMTVVSWDTFSKIVGKHILDDLDFERICSSLPEVGGSSK
ncbi:hypothetical protein CBR_g48195 [Chara braunii]|uniref:Uncharacterized protein n=1 Tax=Chara braunii TaxID=69332 RepID=A0A388M2C4_CHABU|nr:hypothetical protein CBR_g48195 [Chara braunii]|eukprot:GBG88665.1 hypothetical protein CBR_g48195 [Chara braunii]